MQQPVKLVTKKRKVRKGGMNIKFEELRDGMLHVVQKKTLSTVIVPLREDTRRIFVDKY
jgi:hypothetical protein